MQFRATVCASGEGGIYYWNKVRSRYLPYGSIWLFCRWQVQMQVQYPLLGIFMFDYRIALFQSTTSVLRAVLGITQ